MSDERTEALALADKLLDVPMADPDDELRVLARQLTRGASIITNLQNALSWALMYGCRDYGGGRFRGYNPDWPTDGGMLDAPEHYAAVYRYVCSAAQNYSEPK